MRARICSAASSTSPSSSRVAALERRRRGGQAAGERAGGDALEALLEAGDLVVADTGERGADAGDRALDADVEREEQVGAEQDGQQGDRDHGALLAAQAVQPRDEQAVERRRERLLQAGGVRDRLVGAGIACRRRRRGRCGRRPCRGRSPRCRRRSSARRGPSRGRRRRSPRRRCRARRCRPSEAACSAPWATARSIRAASSPDATRTRRSEVAARPVSVPGTFVITSSIT